MSRRLVRLRLLAPLHIGSSTLGEEDTYDHAPSDTLFSAVCHAYLSAFGTEELERMLGRFRAGEPPFLLSSAFPYHREELFLPLPRVVPPDGERAGGKKLLKETSWVPLGVFSRMLGGEAPDGPGEGGGLPRRELLPRVALDRESSASGIYYVRRAVFPEGGGLWFLLETRDEEIEGRLVRALHLLGETGLGGERTMGSGLFEPSFSEVPRALAGLLSGGPPYVAVSRVAPRPEELGAEEGYALVESRGWLLSPGGVQRRRRSAWFFAEGSSFREPPPAGRLLDVTPAADPGHRVYRYGFGMYLGRSR